jgi:beta-galactosidase
VVAANEKKGGPFDDNVFEQDFVVTSPALWTPDTPHLYSAVSKVYEGNTLKDEYTTSFGIRSIEIIPNKGFFLNGKKTMFKGVCNHHDLGPLGGIANDAGIRRQIRILKDCAFIPAVAIIKPAASKKVQILIVGFIMI